MSLRHLHKRISIHIHTMTFQTDKTSYQMGFPGGSVLKESACKTGEAGDSNLIPGSRRSPGGNGNLLTVFLSGKAQTTVYEVAKSRTQLSD